MLAFADMGMDPPDEGRRFGDLKLNKVHYAFITRAQDGDIVVADLKDFVESTVGHGVDPAVDELVLNVTSANGGRDGGSEGGGILSIDWSKLKSLHKDEAKDIIERFPPVYEEARETGMPPWLRRNA